METRETIKLYYKTLCDRICEEEKESFNSRIDRMFDDSFGAEGGKVNIREVDGFKYVTLEDYVRMENYYLDITIALRKIKAIRELPRNIIKLVEIWIK